MSHGAFVLVVGAGFSGAVAAQQMAEHGIRVLVCDVRNHVGGNAYDEYDYNGLLVHRYGPHVFHTNSERVYRYLSQFTDWRPYTHRVRASVGGKLLPMPINRTTINELYGWNLSEAEIRTYLEGVREVRAEVRTSEDVVLSRVGRDLCDRFFRGYTAKQWGLNLSELDASIAGRIPVRTNDDDRYFTDEYQVMPRLGYTQMFDRILDHPLIDVELGVDGLELRRRHRPILTIYTGPIDFYFNFRLGRLQYRSLRFEHEYLAGVRQYQAVGTVNFPNEFAYTRVTEFKHLTGQNHSGTSIVREYPTDTGDPYYPVLNEANRKLYHMYENMTKAEHNTIFVGRLAQYRYYNMDQAVGAALAAAQRAISSYESLSC